ncbi:unnamed protein product [Penicillium bialowiezense]
MARNTRFSGANHGVQVENNEGSITFNQSQTDQEIDRLWLRHLRGPGPDPRQMKNILKESKDKLRRESFEWILRDPKFEKWRDEEEDCLLWIKGGAGKGKTMIAIGLIEELLQFCRKTPNATTYFFCQNADSQLNTLEGMIKGLIVQLLDQQPTLKGCLRSRWDTTTNTFDRDVTSWRTLWHILLEMIDQCDCSNTYLVVDALDECQGGDLDEFLNALVMNGLHSSDRRGVKWLLTSRPLDSAERTLPAHGPLQLSLELESSHISKAVKSYITDKVNELSHKHEYEKRSKEEVEFQLLQKSEETFLWVSLVCKRLEKVSSEDVLAVIQNAPHGLRPLYGQAFKQLGHGQTKKIPMCMRMLKVMMLAYRPLKMGEFAAIAGFEESEEMSLMSLVIRCASFIRLRGHSVDFVHQSVRDYLAENDQQLVLDSPGIFGHCEIAMNCLSYLSLSLKVNLLGILPDTNLKRVEALRAINEISVLENVEYAAIFWGQHVRDIDRIHSRNHAITRGSIIEFLYKKLPEWLECLCLLDMLSVGMVTLQRLEDLFKDEPTPLSFVRDSTRFLSEHLSNFEQWPLQVYVYAAIWTPESSLVRKLSLDRVPWLRSVGPLEPTWGPQRLIFPTKVKNQVNAKVSPDGKLLATVCEQFNPELGSAIYIWDISAKIMQWKFSTDITQGIRDMCFSQDNQKVIWISETDAVHSWRISTGDVHSVLIENPGFSKTVVLSSSGMQVASCVHGHGILIWDTSTGKIRVNIFINHPYHDQRPFFSLDDTQIMFDISERDICIWDTATGNLKRKLVKPPHFFRCLAHSSDGTQIAYHSSEEKVFFWDTFSNIFKMLRYYRHSEIQLIISPDFAKVVFRDDFGMKAWDVSTCDFDRYLQRRGNRIMKWAFSATGDSFVYLTYDGELFVRDVKARWGEMGDPPFTTEIFEFGTQRGIHMEVAFSHDGKRVLFYKRRGDAFQIVDARTGVTERTIRLPEDEKGHITIARFLPGDENIVLGLNGHVVIWEAASGIFQSKLDGTVRTIAVSPDGKHLAAVFHDPTTIYIWNMWTGALVMEIKDRGPGFQHLAFSPDADGQYLLAGQSSFMLGDTDTHAKSEGKSVTGDSPQLYLTHHRGGRALGAWIFCGQQAVIKIPDSVPIELKPYCVDAQNGRIAIGCIGRRGLLVLDIDVEILAETLDAATSRARDYPEVEMYLPVPEVMEQTWGTF